MPGPRLVDVPRIRVTLRVYRVSAMVTGIFLLGLCLMMVFRYGFGFDIGYTSVYGIQLTPREVIEDQGGVDISTLLLIAHGWFYVLYLGLDFILWRLMRFSFGRFLFIALGGVIPLLSFFFEFRVPKWVNAQLDAVETPKSKVAA